MVKLKDFVKPFKNKRNNQRFLTVRAKKLKEFDINLEDLLDINIRRKLKKFGK